jgi:hypothetical protein
MAFILSPLLLQYIIKYRKGSQVKFLEKLSVNRESQYLPPKRKPAVPVDVNSGSNPSQYERLRKLWQDARTGFMEGWEHPSFKKRDWQAYDQRFLNMKDWLSQNPGTTELDYRKYRRAVPKPRRQNWLQRTLRHKHF